MRLNNREDFRVRLKKVGHFPNIFFNDVKMGVKDKAKCLSNIRFFPDFCSGFQKSSV